MNSKKLFEPNPTITGATPISGYISHIKHLSVQRSLCRILTENHNYSVKDANEISSKVISFIEQGLSFYEHASTSQLRIKPVLQYYSYLNFAVALINIYRPNNWSAYRSHGVKDKTGSINKISLNTKVVKIDMGAIPLFHSIISDSAILSSSFSIKSILQSIPMVSMELEKMFGINNSELRFKDKILSTPNGIWSYIEMDIDSESKIPMPVRRINKAMPLLKSDYNLIEHNSTIRKYRSKQKWSKNGLERAEKTHYNNMLKLMNYGGQNYVLDGECFYSLRFGKNEPILPILTATLIFSFILSSFSRYRANLIDQSESSRLNLLFDVFTNEADYYMIPAIRNLLYSETVALAQKIYT